MKNKENQNEIYFALKLEEFIDQVKCMIDHVIESELHGLKCEIWEVFKKSHEK